MATSGGELQARLAGLSPAQRAVLEQRLMARRAESARSQSISPRTGSGPCELSYAQELLWLLSQVFDGGVTYNAPGAFQLEGQLDLDVLARALELLTERHEVLRTTYDVIGAQPMQIVGPVEPVEINLVDLRQLGPDERSAETNRTLMAESRFEFDLVAGPVMRTTVIRLGDADHILMINMHHVCTDGYSRGILYRDLTALYDALAAEQPSPLDPLAIQYADYAVWQRRWVEGGVVKPQLDYWTRQLAGAPSRLDLPTDFQRPAVRAYVGENMHMMLNLETREGLRTAARQADSTLFVALLAAFGSLLSRYSGQDDVVIGTPFAGRNRSELEAMVGYFINPLALRLDLSGDPTFHELLERSRETVLGAFAHADVPYETVVRAINPERDLSQTPVFQAMIVLHNPAWLTKRPKFEPRGIRCVEISHEKGWAKFDVLLGMSERATGLNTTWEYSTELFEQSTVQRMTEHFRAFAEGAAANPNRRLSQLSMLSEGERAKMLVSWNAQPEPLPAGDSVKELFEAQVQQSPDATAVVFAGQRLSYADLNRRANRIASLLEHRGVGPGTLVGVLMEKSIELIPAVLGVVKSGAAYVPLDPAYPAGRLEFMVGDARPAVLLTLTRHIDALPSGDAEVVELDAEGMLDGTAEANPPTRAMGDDLAYVIFTSGSTGEPKGAMIANRSLVSAFYAGDRNYRLRELHAFAQLASFSFDVFTGDWTRALLSGGKLVLCPVEVVIDPPTLYATMVQESVDFAEFVPASASLLFEWCESEGERLDFMRIVVVASEAWRTEKYAFFKGLCAPETRVINSYGLTEATIDNTSFEPEPGTRLLPGRSMPIGRPIANTRVYVLDADLEPQPIGITGELCVGGVAVARGYLNRPELTAERFVPDPFSDQPGALLYRTGDRARWLPDGTIDFIGRNDRQIKIRGFRIEPGEIEAVLERRAEVRSAAVVDRTDPRGEIRLVAYIESAGVAPDAADLRAFLAEHVPNYMIPSAFAMVAELPYSPNGKLDPDSLPEPEWEQAGSAEDFVAPRTETERRIAGIWSDVLKVEQIGVDDNFFALGGHSLLAMQVASRVREAFEVAMTLRTLFDAPTVAVLATEIERLAAAAPVVVAPALRRVSRQPAERRNS